MTAEQTIYDKIKILAPHTEAFSLQGFMEQEPLAIEPFSEERCQALEQLSRRFLKDPILKRDPASIALAYWFRRSQIQQKRDAFLTRSDALHEQIVLPVGRVFHLTPTNVDTLFVYSWALSYLAGNQNILRLSSRQGNPIVDRILELIGTWTEEVEGDNASTCLLTYAHDDEVTTFLSKWCNHRVIWGGDETVAGIRPLPLPSHASERLFGNKFSYAVFDTQAVLQADDDELKKLSTQFFNDMFWFGQMACSSPHLIFWLGADGHQEAVARFEALLNDQAITKQHPTSATDVVTRLSYAFELATKEDISVRLEHPHFASILHNEQSFEKDFCGSGTLHHTQVDNVQEIAAQLGESDQTIAHYGLSEEQLFSLARCAGAKGIDRIVPVGEALLFSESWDGYDLLEDFTKRVVVKIK